MKNNNLSGLLQRSFDELLSEDELDRLNRALRSSEKLREEKKRISAIRSEISQQSGQHFSPFFADRVMREIRLRKDLITNKPDDFDTALSFVFRKIAITGAVIIMLLLSGNYLSGGEFSIEKALGIRHITIEDTWSLNNLISEVTK